MRSLVPSPRLLASVLERVLDALERRRFRVMNEKLFLMLVEIVLDGVCLTVTTHRPEENNFGM